jgi:hypothetical protein
LELTSEEQDPIAAYYDGRRRGGPALNGDEVLELFTGFVAKRSRRRRPGARNDQAAVFAKAPATAE